MAANSLSFLVRTVARFRDAGLAVWVFGGWAEQLRGIRPAGLHRDIDLLYVAADFRDLDAHFADTGAQVILEKRFSHKRAIEGEGVRVEFLLLQPTGGRLVTRFFDGRYEYIWPADTLECEGASVHGGSLPVASAEALAGYRRIWPAVMAARLPAAAVLSRSDHE